MFAYNIIILYDVKLLFYCRGYPITALVRLQEDTPARVPISSVGKLPAGIKRIVVSLRFW